MVVPVRTGTCSHQSPATPQRGGYAHPLPCCGAEVLCDSCAHLPPADLASCVHNHAWCGGVARVRSSVEFCSLVATADLPVGTVVVRERPAVMAREGDDNGVAMAAALSLPTQYTSLYCSGVVTGVADRCDGSALLCKLMLSVMQCNMFGIHGRACLFDCICRANHR